MKPSYLNLTDGLILRKYRGNRHPSVDPTFLPLSSHSFALVFVFRCFEAGHHYVV